MNSVEFSVAGQESKLSVIVISEMVLWEWEIQEPRKVEVHGPL